MGDESEVSVENEGSNEELTPDQLVEQSSDEDSSDVDHGELNEFLGISEKESVVDNSGKKSAKVGEAESKNSDVAKILEELGKAPEESDQEGDAKEDEDNAETVELKVDGKIEKLTMKDLKSFASKGFDYTKKTQELANQKNELQGLKSKIDLEYKEHQTKMVEERNKFQNELKLKEQFDFCLDHLKSEDPVFFEELQAKLQQAVKFHTNPMVEKLSKEVEELKSVHQKNELGTIKQQYESEWNAAKSGVVSQIEKLGIKIDEEKVKQSWIKGGSVKEAIFALYGEQLNKMYSSKVKVDSVKKKTSTMARVPAGKDAVVDNPAKAIVKNRGGYSDITNHILKMAGRK